MTGDGRREGEKQREENKKAIPCCFYGIRVGGDNPNYVNSIHCDLTTGAIQKGRDADHAPRTQACNEIR